MDWNAWANNARGNLERLRGSSNSLLPRMMQGGVGQNFGGGLLSILGGGGALGSTDRYSAPRYNYPLQGGGSMGVQLPEGNYPAIDTYREKLPQQTQTPQQRGK